jgi:amino acid transporter
MKHTPRRWQKIAGVITTLLVALGALLSGGCQASEIQANSHTALQPFIAAGTATALSGGNPVVGAGVFAATLGGELVIPTGRKAAAQEIREELTKGEVEGMINNQARGFIDTLAQEIYSLLKLAAVVVGLLWGAHLLYTMKRRGVGQALAREVERLKDK